MNREQRLDEELRLLRSRFPNVERSGDWFLIPEYPLPDGWSESIVPVAFCAAHGYPGAHPYGIWVPEGLRFKGEMPEKYKEPAEQQPPFSGRWAVFSWTIKSDWKAKEPVSSGSNLLNWAMGFRQRFEGGR